MPRDLIGEKFYIAARSEGDDVKTLTPQRFDHPE
jgi:hypothetical protein